MTDSQPRIRDLSGGIHEIENVFLTMRDGVRIAARIFLPLDAEERPVPAILEYIPYRKRDFMRARDEPIHRWFAAHGYAAVRVDVRGSGDSEGVLRDEYSVAEHRDALEILTWIAGQSWCTGKVGMMGISWGGFNALQVAALRPPELGAVITLCSTDDRYADDAHYMGGCLLNENLQWGAILSLYNALPPDPAIVGDRWRAMWFERLEAQRAFPEVWMQHPWRDDYWKHGSVCEDYGAIEVPVYAIGGWADGYSNAVPRLLAGLEGPRKGLIGPWAHVFPHSGVPGPRIGFLQEAKRWWDQWLLGVDTGILDEPILRVWMQDAVRPEPQYELRPGRWVAEKEWPSPRIAPRTYYLNPGRLEDEPTQSVGLLYRSPQTTGIAAGEWCAFGADGEMPLDQRPDDGRSMIFDSEPLEETVEILGAPVVELELCSDAEVAMVAVRLCDVAPDRASLRVSYGLLNLTHRHSHEEPEPLVPGEPTRVRVQLNDAGHCFRPGHRIRVAVSTCYWPIAWPAPTAATLTVFSGVSTLELPVRPVHALDQELRDFEPPEAAAGTLHKPLRALPFRRVVERDLATDEVVYTLSSDGGEFGGHSHARIEEIDLELGYSLVKRHRISESDPLSACSTVEQEIGMQRGDWRIQIRASMRLEAAADHFHFRGHLEAIEGDELVREHRWDIETPRQFL